MKSLDNQGIKLLFIVLNLIQKQNILLSLHGTEWSQIPQKPTYSITCINFWPIIQSEDKYEV